MVFSLSVDDLTEEGEAVGAYGVTFTNVAGSVSVPTIMVTGTGVCIQLSQTLLEENFLHFHA